MFLSEKIKDREKLFSKEFWVQKIICVQKFGTRKSRNHDKWSLDTFCLDPHYQRSQIPGWSVIQAFKEVGKMWQGQMLPNGNIVVYEILTEVKVWQR